MADNTVQNTACVACSKPLVGEGDFCPFCGTKVVSSAIKSAIDMYIHDKVNLELSGRLKDQSSLVREIGDKAEDVVWKRFTRYGVLVGALFSIVLAFFSFVGINKLDDVSKRIDPIVSAAVQKAQVAQKTIEQMAKRIDSLNDSLTTMEVAVNDQRRKVTQETEQMNRQLLHLSGLNDQVSQLAAQLQKQANEAKQLQKTVADLSRRVEITEISKVFPELGASPVATINYAALRRNKKNDIFVNLQVAFYAQADKRLTPDKVNDIKIALEKDGTTVFMALRA